jgi:hypothetical protein
VLEHPSYYELRGRMIAFLESQDHRARTQSNDDEDLEHTRGDVEEALNGATELGGAEQSLSAPAA